MTIMRSMRFFRPSRIFEIVCFPSSRDSSFRSPSLKVWNAIDPLMPGWQRSTRPGSRSF